MIETIVYKGESRWSRSTYIKLVDNKVVYDDSDDEYGPIEFDIKLFIEALEKHMNQMGATGDTTT